MIVRECARTLFGPLGAESSSCFLEMKRFCLYAERWRLRITVVGEALAAGCACRRRYCSGGNRGISVAKDTNDSGGCRDVL